MLVVAIAIIGILAGAIAPIVANKLDDAEMRGEKDALQALKRDFEATYDATDFANLNLSSVPSSGLPTGTVFTTFDQANAVGTRIYSQSIVVDPAGWVTKLAEKRGVSTYVSGGTYTVQSANEYSHIAFNPYGSQRCLVIGPTGESGQQRYLLLSLMVPQYRTLSFPTSDLTQTFDTIWDQSWESVQAQPPSAWASVLSAADFALWGSVSTNNRTNASRLLVQRIVQPKFSLTLANNSQSDTAWVDIGPAVDAITALPASGSNSSASIPGFSSGILAGRLIVVRRGPTASASYEVERFFLYSDVTLTLQ
ncbi:MAG TPA: type II secretion system protein [Opitutaceae bacterium]|jgi:type II secretory pathway pseudopilin PulG